MAGKRVWWESKRGGGKVKHETTYIPPKSHGRGRRRRRNSGSGCFPSSVHVLTPSGWQSLAAIREGDAIRSVCPGTGILMDCHVLRKLQFPPSSTLDVFGEGESLLFRATKSHSVLTGRGWRTVAQLVPGDVLACAVHGTIEHVKITGIRAADNLESVVNLHTSNLHNFVVEGGVIAHNFTFLRALRTVMHRLFFDRATGQQQSFGWR